VKLAKAFAKENQIKEAPVEAPAPTAPPVITPPQPAPAPQPVAPTPPPAPVAPPPPAPVPQAEAAGFGAFVQMILQFIQSLLSKKAPA
jgi:hypothetical protein